MYLVGNSPEADENGKLGTFLAGDTYQVVKGLHCRLRVISMPTGFSLAPANTP
ncbi:hypothetical protein JCM18918_3467 [Cutibacterium acnes JCM 18918]|nr:hypothetical protein JCM18918_3467 [Cutibacterium acnes JCM 18918]